MKISHLQCNTEHLRDPEAIINYVKLHDIDIACLQEVVYSNNMKDNFRNLVEDHGYVYRYSLSWINAELNMKHGSAIISKFPIADSAIIYYNGDNNNPKNITSKDVFNKQLVGYDPVNFHPASRAMTYIALPTAIQIVTARLPDYNYLRIINTHLPVSDMCIEIPSMYEIASKITSYVKYGENIPTIFSGDLNIRARSYTVEMLETVMKCHTKDVDDTLSSKHNGKIRGDIVKYAVDHVFSRNLNHLGTTVEEVDFSDHKMLISEFDWI